MTDLNSKSVLVTGGSRGIGAAIARAIGAAGGEVIVHYARNRDAAEAVREDIGGDRCHIVQAPAGVNRQRGDFCLLLPQALPGRKNSSDVSA